jgi:hypothetical protein
MNTEMTQDPMLYQVRHEVDLRFIVGQINDYARVELIKEMLGDMLGTEPIEEVRAFINDAAFDSMETDFTMARARAEWDNRNRERDEIRRIIKEGGTAHDILFFLDSPATSDSEPTNA